MIAAGLFPWPESDPANLHSPRVNDGMLRLGRSGKVTYASPNALSAYRRLGLTADLAGRELAPLTVRLCASAGPKDDSLMLAASGRAHLEIEIEANGSVVQMRSIPLTVDGARAGALILLRDVTELRNRERELITKDATIREIHHRVKNNLQTVAALLRLQARRMQGLRQPGRCRKRCAGWGRCARARDPVARDGEWWSSTTSPGRLRRPRGAFGA
jgi:hypothetical protein